MCLHKPLCLPYMFRKFIIGKTNILTVKHSRKRKHRRVAFKFLSAYDRYFIGYAAVFKNFFGKLAL